LERSPCGERSVHPSMQLRYKQIQWETGQKYVDTNCIKKGNGNITTTRVVFI
jgi:hypothetical protein